MASWGRALSALAREELEHFEQVLALLQARGIPLRPLPAPGYGSELSKAIRRQEPERMLDAFLVAGLIEARSHERMGLLAAHSPDARAAGSLRRPAGQRGPPFRPLLAAGGRAFRPRHHDGPAGATGRRGTVALEGPGAIPLRCGCTRRGWRSHHRQGPVPGIQHERFGVGIVTSPAVNSANL
jgi:hypothetical protein